MQAIVLDNASNVRYIVSQDPAFFLEMRFEDEDRLTPIGIACQHGSIETLKVLVELGANQVKRVGGMRTTPICLAATYDHFDCV